MNLYKEKTEVSGGYVLDSVMGNSIIATVINVLPDEEGNYWVEYSLSVDGYNLTNRLKSPIETFLSIYKAR